VSSPCLGLCCSIIFGVGGRRGDSDLRFGRAALSGGRTPSIRVRVVPKRILFKGKTFCQADGESLLLFPEQSWDTPLTQTWNILDSEGIHAQMTAVQSSRFDQNPDHILVISSFCELPLTNAMRALMFPYSPRMVAAKLRKPVLYTIRTPTICKIYY
jgi:hypothetical protein